MDLTVVLVILLAVVIMRSSTIEIKLRNPKRK